MSTISEVESWFKGWLQLPGSGIFRTINNTVGIRESRAGEQREAGTPHPTPVSIGSHSSSSCRYVYIPLGGSQHGLLGTLLSTAMTFVFVSYWHGSYEDLWCWAALNWLGVTVESGVRRLLQTPCVRETLVSMIHHCL